MITFGQEGMKEALVILNNAKEKGIIKDYAIAGGIAAIAYTETFLTQDLDIFVAIKSGLITGRATAPIKLFDYFASKGYDSDGHYIFVNKIPVHILFVDEDIKIDAIKDAKTITFAGIKTQILRPEYLIAIYSMIYLEPGREKDIDKIKHIIKQYKIDQVLLNKILEKYNLHNPLEEKCRKHLK